MSNNYDTRGPNEGTWAAFAEKVCAERDALREELAEARTETKQVRLKTERENEALRIEVAKLRKLITLPFDPMPTILSAVSILNAKNAELVDELKEARVKASAAANEEANMVVGVVCGQGYWTADELLRALGYSPE